ncbi:MAG TPA: PorP/SprF family type IX secretion system membrane protein [Chitinophagales bacterium]|nr:PorP/SprF family type IX secretion system membrane protein [Chitinophagales bacterium]
MLRVFYISMLIALGNSLHAQDIHFSQFYSAPLAVNPSYTGSFNGDYRAGVNYRSQWASVTVPYRTFDLFGDLSLGREFFKLNFFSVGVNLIADRAGDGDLSVTKLMASGAYHIILDKGKMNDISFGLQAGWVQKSVDYSKLYFDNQWNDTGFDTGLPSGENNTTGNFGYPDAAAGVSYAYNGIKKFSAYAGFSMYHLLKPKESFYGQNNHLGLRPELNGGFSYKLSDHLSFSPSIFYQEQKKASEFLAGTMFKYAIASKDDPYVTSNLYIGLYGRFGDALIPVVGYEITHWRLMVNYDVNTSSLKPASQGRGAFEISLIYIGTSKKHQGIRIDLPCPRF